MAASCWQSRRNQGYYWKKPCSWPRNLTPIQHHGLSRTEAYEWAKERRSLTTEDFHLWLNRKGLHNCVVSRPGGREELVSTRSGQKRILFKAQLYFFQFFQGLKDPYEPMRLAKGGKSLLKSMLAGSRVESNCR